MSDPDKATVLKMYVRTAARFGVEFTERELDQLWEHRVDHIELTNGLEWREFSKKLQP